MNADKSDCACHFTGWSRDPYEPHIPARPEMEQADDCPVHPMTPATRQRVGPPRMWECGRAVSRKQATSKEYRMDEHPNLNAEWQQRLQAFDYDERWQPDAYLLASLLEIASGSPETVARARAAMDGAIDFVTKGIVA